jgi:hypothetical protein
VIVVESTPVNGPLAVRKVTKAAILGIRGMGAREAKAKLGEMKPSKKAS